MDENSEQCLSCKRSSANIPLLPVRYGKREYWICPRCLPILIHKPERLEQVAGAWASSPVDFAHD